MIRMCEDDGFFEGETCPECGREGRFVMTTEERDHLSRIIAGILRHFPRDYGIDLSENGWATIDSIVKSIERRKPRFKWLRPRHIYALVDTDKKGRYQIKNSKIRATYGHSIHVDLTDLPSDDIPDALYFPTTEEEADLILETGIRPSDREMVHLSATYEDAQAVGQIRSGSPIILRIDSKRCIDDGIVILQAARTVFLVDAVGSQYLSKV